MSEMPDKPANAPEFVGRPKGQKRTISTVVDAKHRKFVPLVKTKIGADPRSNPVVKGSNSIGVRVAHAMRIVNQAFDNLPLKPVYGLQVRAARTPAKPITCPHCGRVPGEMHKIGCPRRH